MNGCLIVADTLRYYAQLDRQHLRDRSIEALAEEIEQDGTLAYSVTKHGRGWHVGLIEDGEWVGGGGCTYLSLEAANAAGWALVQRRAAQIAQERIDDATAEPDDDD